MATRAARKNGSALMTTVCAASSPASAASSSTFSVICRTSGSLDGVPARWSASVTGMLWYSAIMSATVLPTLPAPSTRTFLTCSFDILFLQKGAMAP
ncbi:hypothetical protein D9M68_928930 [compost metagenome]